MAKLSLWLRTVSRHEPLAFLDHNLQLGNSLLGAWVSDLQVLPHPEWHREERDLGRRRARQLHTFNVLEGFQALVGRYRSLAEMSDSTYSEIKDKEAAFQSLRNSDLSRRLHRLSDVWLAALFQDEVDPVLYHNLATSLASEHHVWADLVAQPELDAIEVRAMERRYFHWELEFPEVFVTEEEGGGFDVVIGNPPYIDIKGLGRHDVEAIFRLCQFASNRVNIYAAFMEQALHLARPGGTVGLIIPNSWIMQSTYRDLYRHLLDHYRVDVLVRTPETLFPKQKVETSILCLRMEQPPPRHSIDFFAFRDNQVLSAIDRSLAIIKGHRDQAAAAAEPHALWWGEGILSFHRQLQGAHPALEENADFCLGLTPYDAARGHTRQQIEQEAFHATSRLTEDHVPLLEGADVRRYRVQWNGQKWIRYGPWLGAPRERRFFVEPRVLVKQIIDWTSGRIHTAATREELYNPQAIFNILPRPPLTPEALQGILNSRLMTVYHRTKFLDPVKIRFQKILIQDARRFPVPVTDEATLARIGALSARRSEVEEARAVEISHFLAWLAREVGADVTSLPQGSKFEEYDKQTAEALVAQLRRWRAKLGVDTRRRDFQEMFLRELAQSCARLADLGGAATALEEEIDLEVARLYGLDEQGRQDVEALFLIRPALAQSPTAAARIPSEPAPPTAG